MKKPVSRSLRYGTVSFAACLLAVAVVAVLTLLVRRLPSRLTVFDTSAQKLYTLTDVTLEELSRVDRDVTVYQIVQAGNEDAYVTGLLERYADACPYLHVTVRDPALYASFIAEYTQAALTDNSLIVVSGDRSRVIDYSQIYTSGTSAVGTSTAAYHGESLLTQAIHAVTAEAGQKIYALTGHGESALSDTVAGYVAQSNLALDSLNLMTGDIPEDCSCILIMGPSGDLRDGELEKLLHYLDGGGHLFLLTNPAFRDVPNFRTLLAAYCVGPVEEEIYEDDYSHFYLYINYLLPTVYGHEITERIVDGDLVVLLPVAQGIEQLDNKRSSLTLSPLLRTSASAFTRPAEGFTKTDADRAGPFDLGVAIREGDTRLVWISSTAFLEDAAIAASGSGNRLLFLDALGYLCGSGTSVSVDAVDLTYQTLRFSEQNVIFYTLLLVVILPLGFAAAGVVICVRRRRSK